MSLAVHSGRKKRRHQLLMLLSFFLVFYWLKSFYVLYDSSSVAVDEDTSYHFLNSFLFLESTRSYPFFHDLERDLHPTALQPQDAYCVFPFFKSNSRNLPF